VLTPLLAVRAGTKIAVAVVSIPHLCATAYRFWTVRKALDVRIFILFGITSAAGGLVGALLNAYATNPVLTIIFGLALTLASMSELSGLGKRVRFHGNAGWIAGAASGLLGGLVGNQGGIRSAAMLGFELKPESFVATATAVALAVDGARVPVYLITEFHDIARYWLLLVIAVVGCIIGTVVGRRVLSQVSESVFRRSVAVLILALGVYMLVKGIIAAMA